MAAADWPSLAPGSLEGSALDSPRPIHPSSTPVASKASAARRRRARPAHPHAATCRRARSFRLDRGERYLRRQGVGKTWERKRWLKSVRTGLAGIFGAHPFVDSRGRLVCAGRSHSPLFPSSKTQSVATTPRKEFLLFQVFQARTIFPFSGPSTFWATAGLMASLVKAPRKIRNQPDTSASANCPSWQPKTKARMIPDSMRPDPSQ